MAFRLSFLNKSTFFSFIVLFIISFHAAASDRPKIGLVLSGGGARGFAHVGVLKMLDSLNIPVDCIAGTSMGGIIGALYSIGYSGLDLERLADRSDWQEIFTDRAPRSMLPYLLKKETGRYQIEFGLNKLKPVTPSGLIFGQKISLLFSNLTFPYERVSDFDHLPVPFRCVASDLVSGERVVLNRGSLSKAMRATMAIPTIFSAVEWNDSLLVDGGLLDNLPVDVVKDMGADIVIAVDVGYPLRNRSQLNSAIAVLEQSMAMLNIDRRKKNLHLVDILIQPDLAGFTIADFSTEKVRIIMKRGDDAVRRNLNALLELKHRFSPARVETRGKQVDQDIRIETVPLFDRDVHMKIRNQENQKQVIREISIEGNRSLPDAFILRLLDFKTGNLLNTDALNRRIMEMYGLGYFENIRYDIEQDGTAGVRFVLTVKELPLKKVRLGIRYDDWHKLVAAVGLLNSNILIPGLRLENELQFAGLSRFRSRTTYPSRTLSLPIYPLVEFNYQDVPTRLMNQDAEQILHYNNRSIDGGIGLGFLLGKNVNMEIKYQVEWVHIHPGIALPDPFLYSSVHDRLRQIRLSLNCDMLDDVLLPKNGIQLAAQYEGSYSKLRSEIEYTLMNVSADLYKTLRRRHTLRFFGFWCASSNHTPIYKFINLGRPEYFVGMQYDQLICGRMSVLRMDYRYQHKKDIFIRMTANTAFGFENRYPAFLYKSNRLWGFGIGLVLLSPIGPIDVTFGRGSASFSRPRKAQNVGYFTLGYKF